MDKLQDLPKRLLLSTMTVAMVGLLLFFSYMPLIGVIIVCFVGLMGAVMMWEYGKLAEAKQIFLSFPLLATGVVLLVFSFFLGSKISSLQIFPFFLLFALAVLIFLFHFRSIEGSIAHISISLLGLLYIGLPLGMLISILYDPMGGRMWVVYLILVTKVSDIGGYFGGRLLGKRKFSPKISPNKTWEGSMAGLLLSVGVSVCFYLLKKSYPAMLFDLSFLQSLVLGVVLGSMGQIGDLAESLLKRDAQKKDSNRLPGIGGVLDMMDSLLFTIPILYFFLRWG